MDKEKLERIVGTLLSKGYDGYVMSQRDTIGKLKEIVADYLEGKIDNRTSGYDGLWFSTYISWSGDGKQYVSCDMWLKKEQGQMRVDKMIVEKGGVHFPFPKRCELNNLSLEAVPTTRQAIELVSEVPKNIPVQEKKGKQRL